MRSCAKGVGVQSDYTNPGLPRGPDKSPSKMRRPRAAPPPPVEASVLVEGEAPKGAAASRAAGTTA
eukprot:2771835-Pyramimonas_sp.AAC.1